MGKLTDQIRQVRGAKKAYSQVKKEFYNPRGEKPLFRTEPDGKKVWVCVCCGADITDEQFRYVDPDGFQAHSECMANVARTFGRAMSR